MGILNWLKSIFSSDDDFSPRVKKESKKVDDTSENKNSEPEVIDKDTIVSKIGPFNTKIKLEIPILS